MSSPKIFVNGCFDVLHAGHFNIVQRCLYWKNAIPKAKVFFALDSDKKVKQDKGLDRPVFSFDERSSRLFSLMSPDGIGIIDFIEEFSTNKHLHAIIENIRPDIMIKGLKWKGNVVGEEFVQNIDFIDESQFPYSSSEIIERIKEQPGQYSVRL